MCPLVENPAGQPKRPTRESNAIFLETLSRTLGAWRPAFAGHLRDGSQRKSAESTPGAWHTSSFHLSFIFCGKFRHDGRGPPRAFTRSARNAGPWAKPHVSCGPPAELAPPCESQAASHASHPLKDDRDVVSNWESKWMEPQWRSVRCPSPWPSWLSYYPANGMGTELPQ